MGNQVTRISSRIGLLAILAMWFFLTGCETVRGLEGQATYYTMSPQQEAQLGSDYNQELSSELTFITDPEVEDWVQDVGSRIVAASPSCDQTFTFHVTTDPAVNAFAIPGGHCYINGGLILEAQNEAEVVAVVAHEVNHVTARHGVRSIQRQAGLSLLQQALASQAGEGGAAVVQIVNQAGGLVAMRSFSRDDEREADKLGAEAMYNAGWDPRQMVSFFEKLHALEEKSGTKTGSLMTKLTSTHPTTVERIDNIKAEVAQFDLSKNMIVDRPEFHEVQDVVREKMKAGQ